MNKKLLITWLTGIVLQTTLYIVSFSHMVAVAVRSFPPDPNSPPVVNALVPDCTAIMIWTIACLLLPTVTKVPAWLRGVLIACSVLGTVGIVVVNIRAWM